MLFMSLEEYEKLALHGDRPDADDEIAPGVRVVRRQVLRIAAAGLGAALLPGRAVGRQEPPQSSSEGSSARRVPVQPSLDFDAWVDQARPLARQIVANDGPDEEPYLRAIAQLLSRLDPVPELSDSPNFIGENRDQAYDLALYYPPLLVTRIILKPRARIELHDHRHYNGVLLNLQGKVRLRNFEIVGHDDVPPEGEEFTIRQTARTVLEPGGLSTLARKRDNLHELVSDDVETHLLDVFTYFRKDARSHELAFDDQPFDSEKRLYKASWKSRG